MRNSLKYFFVLFLIHLSQTGQSQNETKNWYFGNNAGLSFSATPPSTLSNGALNAMYGNASISDAAGNLLFYTDGMTIWDQTHSVMANGGGLTGTNSAQSSVIAKRPASANLYYVFTMQGGGGNAGLNYSIVDMSLASGNGSVTVKNATLYAAPCEEKIAATKACNQSDVWVMVHEINSDNFRAYLLTSAGVSTTAVVSPMTNTFTPTPNNGPSRCGTLKFSPNGKKLAAVYTESCQSGWISYFTWEIFNFDNSSGILSNPQAFISGVTSCTNTLGRAWAYGCEFSPDGKRFYYNYNGAVAQMNFCVPPLVYIGTILDPGENSNDTAKTKGTMQLGVDGKIYIAKPGQTTLGVINNPNNFSAASNYSINGQSLGTNICQLGLPNFVSNFFEQAPSPFTFSFVPFVNCNTLAYNTPSICPFTGYTLSTCSWNFGDPSSGTANTSTLASPTHSYSSSGTFTVQLVSNYLCGKSDTLRQTIVINNMPTVSILSPPPTCAPSSATANVTGGVGPYSYTWSPGLQNTQSATNLSQGVYTVDIKDNGNSNGCIFSTTTVISNTVISASVNTLLASCYGSATGGATVFPAGGSGTYSYTWSGSPLNSATVNSLAAGLYSVSILDVTSQCSVTKTLQILQPLPITTTITVSSPTACVGTAVSMAANSSGGTPVLQYTWVNGQPAYLNVVNESQAGNYIYTVIATDSKGCMGTTTISVYFVMGPILIVSNVSICPQTIATLTTSGAISYNWSPGNIAGNTFTVSPTTSAIYSVTGSDALGCMSTNSVSVNVLAKPIAGISSNASLCVGQTLSINGTGGINYSWTGPFGFSSGLQNPIISQVSLNNSGVYTMTVSDVNSCTATATSSITIYSNPTINVTGSFTICTGETTNLTASGANVYNWNPTTTTGSLAVFSPGSTTTYTVSGTDNTTGCKNNKVITIQVSNCTEIEELFHNNGILKLYPNPNNGYFTVETVMYTEIYIYNTLGSIVLHDFFQNGIHVINLTEFSNGIYLVKAIAQKDLQTFKVIKED
ncbi:T9SS type A sorting domain-containing protein [Aurantibacillus circumpalustris]|uniref:T9SS type A sorting domain-containing protein n=1 Tax=Aurantibacillus circumpalustris TaxID=3036359 RepID=UPI00295BFCD9|nr:T9SS type A sorting domain-containing protein [Aurantibacillus circumpalustris]